jgi:hypothetical protein
VYNNVNTINWLLSSRPGMQLTSPAVVYTWYSKELPPETVAAISLAMLHFSGIKLHINTVMY